MSIDSELKKIKSEISTPDERAEKEEALFKSEQQRIAIEGSEYELTARKKYAERLFWLVFGWIIAVLFLVLVSGYSDRSFWIFSGPKISDSVLIALITGLSVNVIALLVIVVNYLFPRRGND